jgi:hypothetical protein
MCWEYLYEPAEYHLHNMRFSNSVVMTVCFGRRTEKGDVFLKEILDQFGPVLKAMRPGTHPSRHSRKKWGMWSRCWTNYFAKSGERLMVGSNLVDVMPIFEKLPRPLQWWKARGEREYNTTLKAYGKPWYRHI